jgi:hypothetical protein
MRRPGPTLVQPWQSQWQSQLGLYQGLLPSEGLPGRGTAAVRLVVPTDPICLRGRWAARA